MTAFLTGLIATRYGLRPAPFYLGIVYAVAGLLFSLLLVRDTGAHLELEHCLHLSSAMRKDLHLPGV